VETHFLALQARVLQLTCLAWLVLGWWLGQDPATVALRAGIGAFAAMFAVRWLIRPVLRLFEEHLAAEEAEQRMREERAAAAAPAAAVAAAVAATAVKPAGAAR
jgi:hypothetical protein